MFTRPVTYVLVCFGSSRSCSLTSCRLLCLRFCHSVCLSVHSLQAEITERTIQSPQRKQRLTNTKGQVSQSVSLCPDRRGLQAARLVSRPSGAGHVRRGSSEPSGYLPSIPCSGGRKHDASPIHRSGEVAQLRLEPRPRAGTLPGSNRAHGRTTGSSRIGLRSLSSAPSVTTRIIPHKPKYPTIERWLDPGLSLSTQIT